MLEFKDYFPLYEAAGPNKHLTHLEELILTNGKEGATRAIQYLQALTEVLDSDTPNAVNTTVKYDGAPAVVIGVDPNGNFFVGSKSVFAKVPKINYSINDIKQNHSHAPGLVDKLIQTFVHFKGVNFTSTYQGDFLFDDEIKEVNTIDGEDHVIFKPNTIVYAVPTDSEEGQKILNAKIGVVFHTEYDVNLDEEGIPRFTTKKFGVDVTNINPGPSVYVKDAYFESDAGYVTLTDEETNLVTSSINSANQALSNIDFNAASEKMLANINTYINTEIRGGEFLGDGAVSFQKFVEWFTGRIDKQISTLKSDAGIARSTKAKDTLLSLVEAAREDILNIFEFQKAVKQAKDIFIQKYNNMMQGVNMKHYLFEPNGDLVVTEPEGYVAIDATGNAVKFVDRLEFSRANFAIDKDSKFKKT
tara:strand:- start:127 stop:1377 length:1251 start_codon:yes stop_codon:yes gene_type:complete